jgi:hypothetical protein
MVVKGSAKKIPGAQFEISIDGTPRTYRDRKAFAIEAAERLKRKHLSSDVVVKDLQTGEATKIKYKPDLGPRSHSRRSPNRRVHLSRQHHHHLSRYHLRPRGLEQWR